MGNPRSEQEKIKIYIKEILLDLKRTKLHCN